MSHYKTPTIGLINLGCSKNLVDAERLISQLVREGYEIVEEYHEADLVIVNTCGFINDAIDESKETIRDALTEHGRVMIMGCLGKDASQLKTEFPTLLHVVGPNQQAELLHAIHAILPKPHEPDWTLMPIHGIKLTPKHYAYLKISEGCNHNCSYCIIPQLRGPLQSRPIDDILKEATALKDQGVKELLVISQDTTAYGNDLNYKNGLLTLLNNLAELKIWIRLHYLNPFQQMDELIALMANGQILPYLDVPMQHVNPFILKLMKRPPLPNHFIELIKQWRKHIPELTIRSTFIVGFPGETDEAFEELLQFLEEAKLDRVGCFKYSPVKGAAANLLPGQIPETLKDERLDQLMMLQADISAEKLRQKIGKKMEIIIDEVSDDETIGRTKGDSPDVDGVVIIEGKTNLKPGDIKQVKIIDSTEHDLIGTLS